ncbi:MAG: N-glycosylase/DNA lyase [Bacteroidales bacterium]|nr:N-glycosylase/DNA lyase [Bacteroidales bacterium]
MENLCGTYNIIKTDIQNRISEFKSVWIHADEKKLFQELAFCLLTPQSKAKNAWKSIMILTKNQKIYEAEANAIAEDLNLVRFRNNKSRYIVEARKKFLNNSKGIRETLNEQKSIFEKRDWLNKNIKGFGLKESSHFLRNIGFVEDIAILDRHILKNLKKYNVIDEIPKAVSEKKYYEIERKMKNFANKIKIPLEHLDLIFWYNEANTIFK